MAFIRCYVSVIQHNLINCANQKLPVRRALHSILQFLIFIFSYLPLSFGPIKHGWKKVGHKITLLKLIKKYRKSPIENVEFFRYLPSDFGTCQRSDSETLNDSNRTSLNPVTFPTVCSLFSFKRVSAFLNPFPLRKNQELKTKSPDYCT